MYEFLSMFLNTMFFFLPLLMKGILNLVFIGWAGASSLSQALTTNTSLTSLYLRYNSIGAAGASSLSQALTVNSSLTSLYLLANCIGDAGASSLSQPSLL